MNSQNSTADDSLQIFTAATRTVAAEIESEPVDPARLASAIDHQLECFETIKDAMANRSLPPSTTFIKAIEQGQQTLESTRRKMDEIREELAGLRAARAHSARVRDTNPDAQFISRRV